MTDPMTDVTVKLDYLSVAKVSGTDSGAFLHAQFSADIASLQPGESTFACYCNPKGKVIAVLLVYRENDTSEDARKDSFLLIGSTALMTSTLQRLSMYILRAKVAVEEQPGVSVFGCKSEAEDSMTVINTFSDGLYAVSETKQENGESSTGGWLETEITKGISWLDQNISQRFLPQMLGADAIGALSFSKGCYPGQEIVARARYLGKVKRLPMLVRVNGPGRIETGQKISLHNDDDQVDAIVVGQGEDRNGSSLLRLVTSADAALSFDRIQIEDQTFSIDKT